MRTAIIIPAYQAEASVAAVVVGARAIVPEVLVIDDGSLDDTRRRAEQAGAEVVVHPRNRGKGAALRTGFNLLLTRGVERIVTMDADGQHLATELPRLLERGDADLVLGARVSSFPSMSRLRRYSNALSSRTISSFAGRPLGDVQTGFRSYSRRLIERVGMPEDRFDAESAIVVRAARGGFVIVEVPVELGFADGRAVSHYRGLVDSLRIARSVVRAWASASRNTA